MILDYPKKTSLIHQNQLTTFWAEGPISEKKVGTTRPNMSDEIDDR